MLMARHILRLTDATVLCRWILREVEAVFSSGHFLLVNRTPASGPIVGNNRGRSQQSQLELRYAKLFTGSTRTRRVGGGIFGTGQGNQVNEIIRRRIEAGQRRSHDQCAIQRTEANVYFTAHVCGTGEGLLADIQLLPDTRRPRHLKCDNGPL